MSALPEGVVAVGRVIVASSNHSGAKIVKRPKPVPSAQPARDEELAKEVERLRRREQARRIVASERAGEGFKFPSPRRSLADDLAAPPRQRRYTIEGLHPAGGNTLLVAQFKTGKTTLLLNLVRALADGEPFVGKFPVAPLNGRVAFWNYELDDDQFREWMRDIEIERADRVAEPLHLRGRTLRLWEPDVAAEAIEWLRAGEVEFLIVDPAARAWRGLVENENDNAQVAAFTDTLDTIKRESGVRDLVLATHMGRATTEEDNERSRGATRLQDWMDAGWYLTKDGKHGPRTLRADGRDVEVEAIDLRYDELTRRLTTTGQTRDERRESDGVLRVVDALALAGDGIKTSELEEAIEGEKRKRARWTKQAIEDGCIERRTNAGEPVNEAAPPQGVALLCFLTDRGRDLHGRKLSAYTIEEPGA